MRIELPIATLAACAVLLTARSVGRGDDQVPPTGNPAPGAIEPRPKEQGAPARRFLFRDPRPATTDGFLGSREAGDVRAPGAVRHSLQ